MSNATLLELINNYGRACSRYGNPAWERDEGRGLAEYLVAAQAHLGAAPGLPTDADDSLLLCASDLQHSAIYDNHKEMQACILAVAARITALATPPTAARVTAAPSAPAREPLTDERMHQELVALMERLFDARIGKPCGRCEGGTYQADHNGYSKFHRCNKCHHVPMWGEDGRELGTTAAPNGAKP